MPALITYVLIRIAINITNIHIIRSNNAVINVLILLRIAIIINVGYAT